MEHAESKPLRLLLEQLSEQVCRFSDRLTDLEEQVSDLTTDVRLQARRSTIAAELPLLPLSQACSHDGSAGSFSCSVAASPRVAGPVSAAASPRGRRSRAVSHAGMPPISAQQQEQEIQRSAGGGPASFAGPAPTAAAGSSAQAAVLPGACGSGAAPTPNHGHTLSLFDLVKSWGGGVMADDAEQLKQAAQLAASAAAAAAEAQAAAERCQQQVLELRGRQGQAERRLDTLWQLQDTASSNQAALQQLQGQLEEQHQVQHQQQENMVALRAQVLQSDLSCSSNTMACAELHTSLQHVQQRLDQCCRDITRQADQLVSFKEQQQAASAQSHSDLQSAQQHIQQQLGDKQAQLDSCATAAAAALGKCETLRQGAVVTTGRLDAVAGQIKAAVEPLSCRLAELSSTAAAWANSTALSQTAVQQEQLAAGLAQLSTAAARRDHERAQQLAGLANRLEALEGQAVTRDQAVTQESLQHTLSQAQASTASNLQAAVQQLQAQLQAKADASSTAKVTSNLAERFNSSESSLLLGLRALRDKTAVLLESKADAAEVKAWQQGTTDSLAELQEQLLHCMRHTPEAWGHMLPPFEKRQLPANVPSRGGSTDALEQPLPASAGALAAATEALLGAQHAEQAAGAPATVGECVAAAEAALSMQHCGDSLAAAPPPGSGGDARVVTQGTSAAGRATQGSGSSSSSGAKVAKKATRSHSQITTTTTATAAGSLCTQQQLLAAQAARPFSALQPWSVPHSPPSTSVADLHGASINAKLVLAGQQKEATRQQLAQKKPSVPSLATLRSQALHKSTASGASSTDGGSGGRKHTAVSDVQPLQGLRSSQPGGSNDLGVIGSGGQSHRSSTGGTIGAESSRH